MHLPAGPPGYLPKEALWSHLARVGAPPATLAGPADLAATLRALLADRAQWRRYAASGLQAVRRHYSWDAHAARYRALVETVLAERADRRAAA